MSDESWFNIQITPQELALVEKFYQYLDLKVATDGYTKKINETVQYIKENNVWAVWPILAHDFNVDHKRLLIEEFNSQMEINRINYNKEFQWLQSDQVQNAPQVKYYDNYFYKISQNLLQKYTENIQYNSQLDQAYNLNDQDFNPINQEQYQIIQNLLELTSDLVFENYLKVLEVEDQDQQKLQNILSQNKIQRTDFIKNIPLNILIKIISLILNETVQEYQQIVLKLKPLNSYQNSNQENIPQDFSSTFSQQSELDQYAILSEQNKLFLDIIKNNKKQEIQNNIDEQSYLKSFDSFKFQCQACLSQKSQPQYLFEKCSKCQKQYHWECLMKLGQDVVNVFYCSQCQLPSWVSNCLLCNKNEGPVIEYQILYKSLQNALNQDQNTQKKPSIESGLNQEKGQEIQTTYVHYYCQYYIQDFKIKKQKFLIFPTLKTCFICKDISYCSKCKKQDCQNYFHSSCALKVGLIFHRKTKTAFCHIHIQIKLEWKLIKEKQQDLWSLKRLKKRLENNSEKESSKKDMKNKEESVQVTNKRKNNAKKLNICSDKQDSQESIQQNQSLDSLQQISPQKAFQEQQEAQQENQQNQTIKNINKEQMKVSKEIQSKKKFKENCILDKFTQKREQNIQIKFNKVQITNEEIFQFFPQKDKVFIQTLENWLQYRAEYIDWIEIQQIDGVYQITQALQDKYILKDKLANNNQIWSDLGSQKQSGKQITSQGHSMMQYYYRLIKQLNYFQNNQDNYFELKQIENNNLQEECPCKQEHLKESTIFQCDYCINWSHFECAQIDSFQQDNKEAFLCCKECQEIIQNEYQIKIQDLRKDITHYMAQNRFQLKDSMWVLNDEEKWRKRKK